MFKLWESWLCQLWGKGGLFYNLIKSIRKFEKDLLFNCQKHNESYKGKKTTKKLCSRMWVLRVYRNCFPMSFVTKTRSGSICESCPKNIFWRRRHFKLLSTCCGTCGSCKRSSLNENFNEKFPHQLKESGFQSLRVHEVDIAVQSIHEFAISEDELTSGFFCSCFPKLEVFNFSSSDLGSLA